ncbi:MAG: hypothetical protein K2L38_10745 [Dysosmobacter sp.]|nr:hypothetical protein [Dysosmobacter sp.]
MTDLMKLLLDYTLNQRLPRFLDHDTYSGVQTLEARHLAALKDGLSGERAASLERYREDRETIRSLELEAMFLAAFSIARELR